MQVAEQMAVMVSGNIVNTIRQLKPEIPEDADRAAGTIAISVLRENQESLYELYSILYAQYFYAEDIASLLAFYESPIGEKMVSVQPNLMADAAAHGQRWAQAMEPEIGRRIAEELKALGYEL